jgi:hypothetical protein
VGGAGRGAVQRSTQAESPYSVGSNTELTYATSPREPRGRDSGLESAEMSDASEVPPPPLHRPVS